ncbi:MAG: 4-hydroxy-3-methylbut-2-enyl diphosphate reductase [Magnetococcales bacterium]|nr:4-hydroxy-3-methylbut-2-enyl diphosphate reductase [Magnetococcales bacterium]NGZ25979.1 4-hydroxy-3-methylbut-2-enyl diphosphate reductase [Magnetococcales bacterium]
MSRLHVVLAQPRGFCAGVDRAIAIVERALLKFGSPVYVRHEIVHNRRVVEDLRRKGAIFVDEVDQVPDHATIIFSAHGVSLQVEAAAKARPLRVLDATCPLVSKVHREASRMDKDGYKVILIGHQGHPEVVGTVGQLPDGRITVVSNLDHVTALPDSEEQRVAYITQTTLSVDETREVVTALKERFADLREPGREDICYATQNRQNAVKELAKRCQLVLVLGAPNSSNSNRLREVAQRMGTPAKLIESAADVKPEWLDGVSYLGITAGASAPEILVEELLDHLGDRIAEIEYLPQTEENLAFPLPRELQ